MNANVERTEAGKPGDENRTIMSPPAFLDLADSVRHFSFAVVTAGA